MEEYIDVTIHVFDVMGNKAKVRTTLTMAGLIDEVLREFEDLNRKTPEVYAIFMKGQPRPLDRNATVAQLDLQAGDELEFKYARSSGREKLSGAAQFFLREEGSQQVFELQWQPSIIGRPDADPAHNEQLAVNLEPLPNSLRISRRHAQITEEKGVCYIESLSATNPTFINDEAEPVNFRRALKNGDRIVLGKSKLVLTFFVR